MSGTGPDVGKGRVNQSALEVIKAARTSSELAALLDFSELRRRRHPPPRTSLPKAHSLASGIVPCQRRIPATSNGKDRILNGFRTGLDPLRIKMLKSGLLGALQEARLRGSSISPVRNVARFRSRDLQHPYASAVALVLIAFLVRLALDPTLHDSSPLLIFTAAIVIAAGRYGVGAGTLATVLSLALGCTFFMGLGFPPRLSWEFIAHIGVFLATAAAMLSVAGHLKASQESERRLHSSLQQAQTETAMRTMAATLAHELNQPLAAAANYIAAGKRLVGRRDDSALPVLIAGLGDAEAQIHRASDIIRHARSLAANSTARADASLRQMVDNAVAPLRISSFSKGILLRIDIAPDADKLNVNAIQIEQVLLNLLRNSCQVTQPERPWIDVTANAEDEFVTVEVRDFGPGISEAVLPRLFAAGVGSTTGGLGLGLSISRTIIEAHGGRMWARNNVDGGASFFFTAPKAPV